MRRPGQILPILGGIFLAVLGMLVLVGSGMHWGHLASSTGDTLSFRQSGLLAIVELGFGIALVWVAGVPWFRRLPGIVLGAAAIAFGIALAAWSGSLAGLFGGDAASGWLFIAVGVVTILGALIPAVATPAQTASAPDLETPTAPAKPVPPAGWIRRAG